MPVYPVASAIWQLSGGCGRLCGMTAGSPQCEGAEWFTAPVQGNHRRYEALRAYFTQGLSYAEAGARFGYTRWAIIDLVRRRALPRPKTGPLIRSISAARACPP